MAHGAFSQAGPWWPAVVAPLARTLGIRIASCGVPLAFDIAIRYHSCVNSKQRKVLIGIFAKPTLASIIFADIESLIKALGGTVLEREGSRVSVQLMGEEWRCHRPHPGKEAKRYQVEQARDLLDRVGVRP